MAITVTKNLWLYGIRAVALITVDDFCPLDQGGEYDYGGDITAEGLVNTFFVDQVLSQYPACKVNWFTIPNMRQDLVNTEIFNDGTYRLRNQQDWVTWVKTLQATYPQLVLSYHGWIHVQLANAASAGEFTVYDAEETLAALESMKSEFKYVGLELDNAFRPPGWAYNQTLLDWLADNDMVFCDNKALATSDSEFLPSYYTTDSGKKLVRIAVPSIAQTIVLETYNGNGIIHYHWTQPNNNRLSLEANQTAIIVSIRTVISRNGKDVVWLSYGEMGEHFKKSNAVSYEETVTGTEVSIQTENTAEELTGVTFQFAGGHPTAVTVLDVDGASVSGLRTTLGNRDCFICGITRLPLVGGSGRKTRPIS